MRFGACSWIFHQGLAPTAAFLTDGRLYQVPFRPRSLVGRTGRGDTCFASYLGMRLMASPEEATRAAAAVTTLKLEEPGPWRGSRTEIRQLLQGEAPPGG